MNPLSVFQSVLWFINHFLLSSTFECVSSYCYYLFQGAIYSAFVYEHVGFKELHFLAKFEEMCSCTSTFLVAFLVFIEENLKFRTEILLRKRNVNEYC